MKFKYIKSGVMFSLLLNACSSDVSCEVKLTKLDSILTEKPLIEFGKIGLRYEWHLLKLLRMAVADRHGEQCEGG